MSTCTLMSSPLIEITAAVGGGAGGVFGALPVFVFVEPPAEDFGPEDDEAGALVFCTDWTKGSLLAKFANSVSWPGSACGCTNARIDCAGVCEEAGRRRRGGPLAGACVVLTGFGAGGADADVSTIGRLRRRVHELHRVRDLVHEDEAEDREQDDGEALLLLRLRLRAIEMSVLARHQGVAPAAVGPVLDVVVVVVEVVLVPVEGTTVEDGAAAIEPYT